jgi:hypothetical protein
LAITVSIIQRTAGSRSSKTAASSPESRSTPSVSCVRSFDPIENPSNRLANSSARITFEGISHIT